MSAYFPDSENLDAMKTLPYLTKGHTTMRLLALFLVLFSVTAFAEDDGCTQLQPNSWAWIQKDCHLGQAQLLPPSEPTNLDSKLILTDGDYNNWINLYIFTELESLTTSTPRNLDNIITTLKYSPNNPLVFVAQTNRLGVVWNLTTKTISKVFSSCFYEDIPINDVFRFKRKISGNLFFSSDGSIYTYGDFLCSINFDNNEYSVKTNSYKSNISTFSFNEKEKLLMLGETIFKGGDNYDGRILFAVFRRHSSYTPKPTQHSHSDVVTSIEFSKDNKLALSSGGNSTFIWNIHTQNVIKYLLEYTPDRSKLTINSAIFSPDSKQILSGSTANTLTIWDVETGEKIHTFTAHSAPINAIAVSPDGKVAVTASDDNTLKLWDVVNYRLLHTLEGHTAAVTAVDFAPDGKTILSGSKDGTIKLWGAPGALD
jgi:WD40 repeat protein